MYFKEKEDTNIDKEFSNNKNKNFDIKKMKPILFIVGGLVLLIVLILIIASIFNNSNKTKITLEGDQSITISLGDDYIEPGYKAYDKKGNDITNQVKITSDLNIKKTGTYEILYSIDGISKIRYVIVTE